MIQRRAYSVFKVGGGGIILPTDLKGDLLNKNRYTISESFYEALWSSRAKLISRLHSAVYNLIS